MIVGGQVADSDQLPATDPAQPASSSEQVEWLVDTFGVTLFRVAFAIVRDRGTAEDVVQEVLVKAWSSMPSWESDTPIRWARTVTRNTALSYLRSAAARPATPTERLDSLVTPTAGADEIVMRSAETDHMWEVFGRLGAEDRALLVMHEIDEVNYEEIADTLGLTVSAVKSKLYRARNSLRSEVKR